MCVCGCVSSWHSRNIHTNGGYYKVQHSVHKGKKNVWRHHVTVSSTSTERDWNPERGLQKRLCGWVRWGGIEPLLLYLNFHINHHFWDNPHRSTWCFCFPLKERKTNDWSKSGHTSRKTQTVYSTSETEWSWNLERGLQKKHDTHVCCVCGGVRCEIMMRRDRSPQNSFGSPVHMTWSTWRFDNSCPETTWTSSIIHCSLSSCCFLRSLAWPQKTSKSG